LGASGPRGYDEPAENLEQNAAADARDALDDEGVAVTLQGRAFWARRSMAMNPTPPEDLLSEVAPRSATAIVIAVLVTLVTCLLGLFSWAALMSWFETLGMHSLAPPRREHGEPLSSSAAFGLAVVVWALFLFFLRTSVRMLSAMVAGSDSGRSPLIPGWLPAALGGALLACALALATLGVLQRDAGRLAGAVELAVFAMALFGARALLRPQSSREP
jgi:hypothetical protein